MNDQPDRDCDRNDLAKGLPMFTASAPEVLAEEKAQLAEVEGKGILHRWRVYGAKSGPGWLQSALVLGSGSAMASLFAGAYLQYKLLWVQPLAMALGIVMFAAMSYQTLSTGIRPFDAMRRFIHPAVAWGWAIGALVATVIWHLPQYALAAGMTEDMIKATTEWEPSSPAVRAVVLIAIGLGVLAVSTTVVWCYSSGHRGIRIYERTLKALVWMIVLAFLIVIGKAVKDGGMDWAGLFKGFLPLHFPTDRRGVSIVMAAFSAATGINATFLFPYTLLARGWGKEHRGLSRFDLLTGMLLPFCIATSLMVIATGCTIYPQEFEGGGTMLPPMKAAQMLEDTGLSMLYSRIVFGLGVIGMALTSITMHMLICGFAACEAFGVEPGGWRYRLACLIPAPAGVAGVVLWPYIGPWIAIPASAICGLMLPIAFIAFFILNNSKRYLGEHKPTGIKALVWNIAMLVSISATMASIIYYLASRI